MAASLYLVAHVNHGLRIGTDEYYALFLASAGELGVLAQKTISWVDGVDLVLLGHFDDLIDT